MKESLCKNWMLKIERKNESDFVNWKYDDDDNVNIDIVWTFCLTFHRCPIYIHWKFQFKMCYTAWYALKKEESKLPLGGKCLDAVSMYETGEWVKRNAHMRRYNFLEIIAFLCRCIFCTFSVCFFFVKLWNFVFSVTHYESLLFFHWESS